MTMQYLMGRSTLKRVCQLVDCRHGLKPKDVEMMDDFDRAAVSYQIILTKADKVGKAKAEDMRQTTQEAIRKRPAAYPEVLVTSQKKNRGAYEVLRV